MHRFALVPVAFVVLLAPACKKKPMDWAENGSGSSHGSSSSDNPSGSSSGSSAGDSEDDQPKKPPSSHALSADGSALDAATIISIGADRACALADDKLWCWEPGQPATQVTTPKSLTAVGGASCGLDDDGNLDCWKPKVLTAPANSLGGQVVASGNEVCVGHRMAIKCWHAGDSDPHAEFDWPGVDRIALGNNKLCSAVSGGTIECADITRKEVQAQPVPGGPSELTALSMAGSLGCGTYQKGTVECWADPTSRKVVPGVKDATDVAIASNGDACALVGNGFVTCWHVDANGTVAEASVKQIGGVRNGSAVGVGIGYGCALNGDSKVVCWGKASKEPLTAQTVGTK